MADQCQAKSDAPPPPQRRMFGKMRNVLSKDPRFVAQVLELRNEGMPLDKIADKLKCHRNTVVNILAKNGGDPLDRVHAILRDGLPRVAEMVMAETIRKKDVRAGVQILTNAGQLDALRPKPAVEDGGRIVIEWSGAPPPWSPVAVLKAYAERAVPPKAELHDSVPIAEVVSEHPNAENSEARVEP